MRREKCSYVPTQTHPDEMTNSAPGLIQLSIFVALAGVAASCQGWLPRMSKQQFYCDCWGRALLVLLASSPGPLLPFPLQLHQLLLGQQALGKQSLSQSPPWTLLCKQTKARPSNFLLSQMTFSKLATLVHIFVNEKEARSWNSINSSIDSSFVLKKKCSWFTGVT